MALEDDWERIAVVLATNGLPPGVVKTCRTIFYSGALAGACAVMMRQPIQRIDLLLELAEALTSMKEGC